MIDDNYFSYKFWYKAEDTEIEVTLNETDNNCLPWPQILNRFIRFLEMTHDYQIMDKVRLKYSNSINTDTDWQGQFFDVPENAYKAGLTE